jgi:nucleotide-binding universal stress UspA family protein
MSIKDIFLNLDDSPACGHRIDVALSLAQRQGARVIGLSIVAYGYYQPHYLRADEKLAAVEAMLESKAGTAGVEANYRRIESTVVGVGTRELLISSSHCSDLIVVGQESQRTSRDTVVVEHLVTGAGRPVLIVPAAGAFTAVGRRVLVAWRNGREAARALHDALPILQRAEQVTLLSVVSGDDSGQSQWEVIQDHLKKHDIQPRTEIRPVTSATLADTLLNHASEGGYDLLVMGAYQPVSRKGLQLGAAARQILREMTIPVLMSH